MPAGIWNILLGLLAVAAGLSGQFTIIGTRQLGLSDTTGKIILIGAGGLLALYGLYQVISSRKQS